MECWWAQPSSHDGSVHIHSRMRSVSGMQVIAAGWNFEDLQNQLDGIVRNKAIYLKDSADAIKVDWKWIQTGSVNSH